MWKIIMAERNSHLIFPPSPPRSAVAVSIHMMMFVCDACYKQQQQQQKEEKFTDVALDIVTIIERECFQDNISLRPLNNFVIFVSKEEIIWKLKKKKVLITISFHQIVMILRMILN